MRRDGSSSFLFYLFYLFSLHLRLNVGAAMMGSTHFEGTNASYLYVRGPLHMKYLVPGKAFRRYSVSMFQVQHDTFFYKIHGEKHNFCDASLELPARKLSSASTCP